jgi:Glycosyl hydrolases family 39
MPRLFVLAVVAVLIPSRSAAPAEGVAKVTVSWDKVTRVSQTTPTLQVVVNPPLRRGTPVHDNAFKALRDLQADYVRYVPWLPYPRLGVAALEPPKDGKTSWDFSLIDPMTIDFLEATRGHPVVLNFSTIPAWLHKTEEPVPYPADPDEAVWKYTQRTEPRDPSFKEIAEYYARLLAWYTQGGFRDELGKRHESGHRYAISHWEVLNEPDLEYPASPRTYTRLYDAVVEAMRRVQPDLKFVGVSLAFPRVNPDFFEYFLDKRNHKPGIPLDYISYHFYAVPDPDESAEVQEHTFFTQAESFLNATRYIETIRKRLSPETKTTINEIGAISAEDLTQGEPGYVFKAIRNSYWNLASATYAYIFGELSRIGIDVAGESQLVGYPTQFPSVSMVDWKDGKPNARYWALKLLKDNFGPGDKLVETQVDNRYVYALAAVKSDGKRRVLLVNKRNRPFEVSIPGARGGQMDRVDQTTAFQPPASSTLGDDEVTLGGFAVAVVTLR